jgi:hypothetical protein
MTLADLVIGLALLALGWLIVLEFVWSMPDRAAQPKARPRTVAVAPVSPVLPSDTGERLRSLELAELARLGEVRRAAEARLREVGR